MDILIAGASFYVFDADEEHYYIEDRDYELCGRDVERFKIWQRGRWVNNIGHRTVKVLRSTFRSGDLVKVKEDDGRESNTTVKQEAWRLGDGTFVIGLNGKSGGYLLNRVSHA